MTSILLLCSPSRSWTTIIPTIISMLILCKISPIHVDCFFMLYFH
jgi:hypothetical protein